MKLAATAWKELLRAARVSGVASGIFRECYVLKDRTAGGA